MIDSEASAPELHADHRHWKSDISSWQDDVQNWRSQHETALKSVEQIAETIREHGKALEVHANALTSIATNLESHEQELALSLRDGSVADLDDSLVTNHAVQAESLANQRDAHERIKKHHHTAIAQVAILRAALDAAM